MKPKNINLLVKATHRCNLKCQYCYDKINQKKYGNIIMDQKHVNKIIDLITKNQKDITWIWHGGEPTCAPISFYKEAIENTFKKYDCNFKFQMQTNGTNFNEDWIKFNTDYEISTGFSYDGMDSVRDGTNGEDLKQKLQNYKKKSGELGTITVINESNVDRMLQLYKELLDMGVSSVSFNFVFYSGGAEENELLLNTEKLYKNFKEFTHYILTHNEMWERSSTDYAESLLGVPITCCSNSDCRYRWLGFAPDGTIFPCDIYYPDKYQCGNVMDYDNILDAFDSPGYKLFASEVEEKFFKYCSKCSYFFHCKGGCNGPILDKYGSANHIDEAYCKQIKTLTSASYAALKDIDVYEDTLHNNLSRDLASFGLYLPKEIQASIKRVFGISYEPLTDKEIFENQEELFDTAELQIFRLINPYKKDIDCIYIPIEEIIETKHNLSNIRKSREEELDKLVQQVDFNLIKKLIR